ncbi:hypothetical protein ROBYS_30290 [Roseobacter sp. OBYS 0001]|nr:hypothetical protein ROBYS_30290 [Roseobacter sp. OBYS 0001]
MAMNRVMGCTVEIERLNLKLRHVPTDVVMARRGQGIKIAHDSASQVGDEGNTNHQKTRKEYDGNPTHHRRLRTVSCDIVSLLFCDDLNPVELPDTT